MNTRIYWIDTETDTAILGIMPRPKGEDELRNELEVLALKKVKTLVCLLTHGEMYELGLKKEKDICLTMGIDCIHFPITDRALPESERELNKIVVLLTERLAKQEKVVIHCRMGIGRAGMLAAALLIENGAKADQAIKKISKARGIEIPDTDQQRNWILSRKKTDR